MAVDKAKLLAAIDAKLTNAYGGDVDQELSRDRASLLEAYLGLNTNPAPEGRSQVVDRSVYETISTMLPSLVRIFAGSSDEVCKFVPVGPEDEKPAELTTAYVNHVVTQKNPWEQICADWIFDSLLLRNGYAMAYWDESEKVEQETYEGQSDDQIAFLLQDPDVKVVQHSQRPDEDQIDPMTGQPQMVHDVVVERNVGKGRACIQVLPPEHCIVDGDCPNWMLRDAKYFEFRQLKTISELRQMGLDVDEDVSDDIEPRDTDEDLARNRLGENQLTAGEEEGVMRKVTVRMVWIECALDDKTARMYYAIIVGRTPLFCEPCGRIQVASITPQPLPHRHPGMSVAEVIKDQQEIKTVIKRGALDNLYLANNGRYAISEFVSLDDFLDSRPGGVVRLTGGARPGEGHIFPLVHQFAFDQIMGSMAYLDQEREARVGVGKTYAGTDPSVLENRAPGVVVNQLQGAAGQRVEHVARMMAPGFEDLFSIVHELIQKHRNKPDIIKLKGEWVPIDPSMWANKRDCRISVGVGAGAKDAMLAQLNMTFQEQVMLAQSPLGLVKPENIYETQIEKAKLIGYANPSKFYTDPRTNPPQPQPPPPELIKIQADMQKHDKQLAFDAQKAQQDAQLEMYKANLQAQTAQFVAQIKAAIDEQSEVINARANEQRAEIDRLSLKLQALETLGKVTQSAREGEENVKKAKESSDNASKMMEGTGKMFEDLMTRLDGEKTVGIERIRDPKTGAKVGYRVKRKGGSIEEVPIQ